MRLTDVITGGAEEVDVGYRQCEQRGVLCAVTLVVGASLSACASASEAPSHRPSSPVTVSPTGCSRDSAYQSTLGFELSIAAGAPGSPSPQQAAVSFAKHGGVSGFGTATTRWLLERDAQGVTVHDATTYLRVVRVATGGWVVDGGGRCG